MKKWVLLCAGAGTLVFACINTVDSAGSDKKDQIAVVAPVSVGTALPGTAPVAPESKTTDPNDKPWVYLSKKDFGIRDDDMGDGRFRTSRNGGQHSGIDYLMPVGTVLVAPCTGKYFTGTGSGGYGNWVQVVCPAPAPYGTNGQAISMLYGHLNSISLASHADLSPGAAGSVEKGTILGKSGKTGNANSSDILAHLHFEAVVRNSMNEGLGEAHQKGDETATGNAAGFFQNLKERCLKPANISTSASISLGNRVDPFLLFVCLSSGKPPFEASSLQPSPVKWSQVYKGGKFNFDGTF